MGSKDGTTRKPVNYARMFTEMICAFKNKQIDEISNDITYNDFIGGYALFCFDLRNDRNPQENQIINQPEGVLKLLLEFHVALAKPVVLLMLLEYQKMISIRPNGGEIELKSTTAI
jgi:hypothetical protein